MLREPSAMQQPISWDRFARDLAAKEIQRQQSNYCVNCGKPIVMIRANTPEDHAVRSRQIAMGLCWTCAGGSPE